MIKQFAENLYKPHHNGSAANYARSYRSERGNGLFNPQNERWKRSTPPMLFFLSALVQLEKSTSPNFPGRQSRFYPVPQRTICSRRTRRRVLFTTDQQAP